MYKELKESLLQNGFGGRIHVGKETREQYATDESIFSVMPEMVVIPKDEQDVETLVVAVKTARSEQNLGRDELSLTMRAAGTGLSGGSLNNSIVVDMRKFDAISEIEEENGEALLSVGPGVYFRDIDKITKDAGYLFPPYPSSRDICMIGGMVANNVAGPNSLKYGHTANYVESVRMVTLDGETHSFGKLTHEQLQEKIGKGGYVGDLYKNIWEMIDTNKEYVDVLADEPAASKNTSGYAIWNVLDSPSLDDFKKGKGTFSLVSLICGSQGTLGCITEITLSLILEPQDSDLLIVPIYDLEIMGEVIEGLLEHKPYNIELFDDKTFSLALKNPLFFKNFYKTVGTSTRVNWVQFSRWLYHYYFFNFKRKIPRFILMVKFDGESKENANKSAISCRDYLEEKGYRSDMISDEAEEDMFWRVRGSSYSLAKLGSKDSRPAAFLEDMVVSPKEMAPFLTELEDLLEKYQVQYAVHGHGGNGHFHFYPLFDFTNPKTPETIMKMTADFFTLAQRHGGNICGEHNDGIIRTPFMEIIFDREAIDMFEKIERVFDTDDIFNPGKKVNPRFDIKENIRKTN